MATETRKRRPSMFYVLRAARQLAVVVALILLVAFLVLADILLWRAVH